MRRDLVSGLAPEIRGRGQHGPRVLRLDPGESGAPPAPGFLRPPAPTRGAAPARRSPDAGSVRRAHAVPAATSRVPELDAAAPQRDIARHLAPVRRLVAADAGASSATPYTAGCSAARSDSVASPTQRTRRRPLQCRHGVGRANRRRGWPQTRRAKRPGQPLRLLGETPDGAPRATRSAVSGRTARTRASADTGSTPMPFGRRRLLTRHEQQDVRTRGADAMRPATPTTRPVRSPSSMTNRLRPRKSVGECVEQRAPPPARSPAASPCAPGSRRWCACRRPAGPQSVTTRGRTPAGARTPRRSPPRQAARTMTMLGVCASIRDAARSGRIWRASNRREPPTMP